jgi:hypothetical protein
VLHSRVGCGLTHKYKTKLEMLARGKHSSLLRTFVNYGRRSRINKTSFSSELTKGPLSYTVTLHFAGKACQGHEEN